MRRAESGRSLGRSSDGCSAPVGVADWFTARPILRHDRKIADDWLRAARRPGPVWTDLQTGDATIMIVGRAAASSTSSRAARLAGDQRQRPRRRGNFANRSWPFHRPLPGPAHTRPSLDRPVISAGDPWISRTRRLWKTQTRCRGSRSRVDTRGKASWRRRNVDNREKQGASVPARPRWVRAFGGGAASSRGGGAGGTPNPAAAPPRKRTGRGGFGCAAGSGPGSASGLQGSLAVCTGRSGRSVVGFAAGNR